MGMLIQPYLFSTVADWSTWDETSEVGLATADTFAMLFENTSVAGNETGVGGGLTGADLVWTQSGALAGATGSPPCRQFDGSDDLGTFTATWFDTFFRNRAPWTFVLKVNGTAAVDGFMLCYNSTSSNASIKMVIEANKLVVGTRDTGVDYIGSPADSVPTTGDVYLFAAMSAAGRLVAGWSTSKPTDYTAITSTQRVEIAASGAQVGDYTLNTGLYLFTPALGDAYVYGGKAYYAVVSKAALIANV